MNNKIKSLIIALTLALPTLATAADHAEREEGGPRQGGHGGPRGGHRPPPPPPLVVALDENKDGVIDASEISRASELLAKLDKNADGQLTREELRPERPHRPEGVGRGEGRPPGDHGDRPKGPRPPRGPRPAAPTEE